MSADKRVGRFFSEISVVGLKEQFETKYVIIRILWLLSLLTGLIVTAYFMFYVIHDYQSNPTTTKVSYTIWKNGTPIYVGVQNRQIFDDYWSKFGMTDEALAYIYSWMPSSMYSNVSHDQARLSFENFVKERNINSLADLYQPVANALKQNITVDFNGEPFDDMYYLNYRYVYKKHMKVYASPADPNQVFNIQVSVPNELAVNSSLSLIIDKDIQDIHASFFELDINTDYALAIDAKRFKLISVSNSCCSDTDPMLDDKHLCYVTCLKLYFEACSGCTLITNEILPLNRSAYETCSCLKHNFNACSITEKKWKQEMDTCLELKCAACKPCDEMFYQYAVTKVKPTKGGGDGIAHSHVVLTLLYAVGVLTFEEVQSYSLQSAISNVGGQLGLWLGLSVITVVQIVLNCLTRLMDRILSPKDKTRNQQHLKDIFVVANS